MQLAMWIVGWVYILAVAGLVILGRQALRRGEEPAEPQLSPHPSNVIPFERYATIAESGDLQEADAANPAQ
jgi:hypothetical protein